MNSKTFFHRVRTITLTDLKRYWIIAAAAFVLHALGTNVALVLRSPLKADDPFLITLTNFSSPTDFAVTALLPIFAAVAIFKYLNQIPSVTAVHALPVSRKQLIAGHAPAGYILCVLPVTANKLISALIMLSIPNSDISGVFETLGLMLTSMLFIYAVSILSCMLCGTTLMAVTGAIGLNILVPSIGLFLSYYGSYFLTGYAPTPLMSHMTKASPLIGLSSIGRDDRLAASTVIYILISIAIFILCYLLYKRRKAENATEPLAFGFMIPIVCALFTFFFSTVLASLFEPEIPLIAGLAIFGLTVYIFSRMFVLKTTKIFNKSTAKSLGIYALIMAVLISGYVFDITGYEKKTADTDKTVSVEVNIFSDLIHDERLGSCREPLIFTDKSSIMQVKKLHQEYIDAKVESETAYLFDSFALSKTFNFVYKNGREFARSYTVCPQEFKNNESVKSIYESEEFKNHYMIDKNINLEESVASIYPVWDVTYDNRALDGSKTKELAKVLDKDFKSRTFKQAVNAERIGHIEFYTTSNDIEGDFLSVTLYETDKNTIQWLKKNNYYSKIGAEYQRVTKIEIQKGNSDSVSIDSDAVGKTFDKYLKQYGGTYDNGGTYATVTLSLTNTVTGKRTSYMLYYDKKHCPDF